MVQEYPASLRCGCPLVPSGRGSLVSLSRLTVAGCPLMRLFLRAAVVADGGDGDVNNLFSEFRFLKLYSSGEVLFLSRHFTWCAFFVFSFRWGRILKSLGASYSLVHKDFRRCCLGFS